MSTTQFHSLKDQFFAAAPASASRRDAINALVDSILVDVEALLCARPRVVSWPSHLAELETSLVNYGLPDFAGEDLANHQDREQLGRRIEAVIRKYELRLQDVHVRLLADGGPSDSAVRFQISARVGAVPDIISFDIQAVPSSGRPLQLRASKS